MPQTYSDELQMRLSLILVCFPLARYMRVETLLVLVMAFVVNLFVVCVFADAFYGVLTTDEVRCSFQ
jgi:hypothetical protein